MVEAFNFARTMDSWKISPEIETPQYEDNGDGISHSGIIPTGGDGPEGAIAYL
jgi:hypothetical protein